MRQQGDCNRRSFDCGTHDDAVSAFAQDDSLLKDSKLLVDVELLGVEAGVGFDEDGFAYHLLHLL
jgi:hypothetical protein